MQENTTLARAIVDSPTVFFVSLRKCGLQSVRIALDHDSQSILYRLESFNFHAYYKS